MLPAPTAPSEGSAGVRSTLAPPLRIGLRPRFSILAHQLRRRFPSISLLPEKGPGSLLECATRGLAALSSSRPARRPSHPKFCGPSWDDHFCVPLCFLTREPENGVAQKEDHLFRRLSRLVLVRPESLAIACRRRSVLRHPAASSCRCRPSERLGPLPRSPSSYEPRFRVAPSEKCGVKPVDNGDIGNNRWNPAANG